MSEKLRCNACGGTYRDSDSNGIPYFHACAPIKNPTFQPDPSKPNYDGQETIERPNKRDESIIVLDTNGKTTIKSAGTGVTVI